MTPRAFGWRLRRLDSNYTAPNARWLPGEVLDLARQPLREPHVKAGEPPNLHAFTDAGRDLIHELANREARLATPRLPQQGDGAQARPHLPTDAAVDELPRLAVRTHLVLEQPTPLRQELG